MPFWFYVLIGFVVVDLILAVWILWKKSRTKKFSHEEFEYMKANWIRIIDSFDAHPKQGIMDADKLLDYALEKKGFAGTLGEKLKKSGPRFSDLNGVWQAHKLRNQIAHELGDINLNDAHAALKFFKKGLNDLGAGL